MPVGDVETLPVERPIYRERARPASYRTAEYSPERPVLKRGRSWQKSAIIIGSSAGVGAGVGAAVGGKKGALIGAADRWRRCHDLGSGDPPSQLTAADHATTPHPPVSPADAELSLGDRQPPVVGLW